MNKQLAEFMKASLAVGYGYNELWSMLGDEAQRKELIDNYINNCLEEKDMRVTAIVVPTKKVDFIKEVREVTSLYLKEAKEFSEGSTFVFDRCIYKNLVRVLEKYSVRWTAENV